MTDKAHVRIVLAFAMAFASQGAFAQAATLPNSPALTTQLFFPGVAQNSRDSIFDPSLVLNTVTNADGTQSAVFNFVVQSA